MSMDQKGFIITKPQTPPHGYRSCVAFITDKQLDKDFAKELTKTGIKLVKA